MKTPKHIKAIVFQLLIATVIFSSCKKDNCKEDWPEGYQYYKIENSKSEAVCTTPLLVGWYKHNPNGANYRYQMKLTPQQGLTDIQLNADMFHHFKAPIQYTLNTGLVSDDPFQMFINVNQQWYNDNLTYWQAISGSCTVVSVDTVSGEVSLVLNYKIAPNGDEALAESYSVELENYPMPWNSN